MKKHSLRHEDVAYFYNPESSHTYSLEAYRYLASGARPERYDPITLNLHPLNTMEAIKVVNRVEENRVSVWNGDKENPVDKAYTYDYLIVCP